MVLTEGSPKEKSKQHVSQPLCNCRPRDGVKRRKKMRGDVAIAHDSPPGELPRSSHVSDIPLVVPPSLSTAEMAPVKHQAS